jgi:phytanoyl-CoA hydroxylase
MLRAQTIGLNQGQIDQYRRDGYLVVHDVLTEAEANAFVEFENEPKPDGWRQDLRHHVDVRQWQYLATHPNVVGLTRQLMDGEEPMIVQSMYLEKKPAGDAEVGGAGIALHQDLHYLPCDTNRLMACWMALSDTDGENGGLCVVPGSQERGLLSTHKTDSVQDHDSWEFEYSMRDRDGREWKHKMYSFEIDGLRDDEIIRLTVPKGSAVFFDGLTIHGSFGNRSRTRPRRAFAVHFVPKGTWMYRTDVQELTPAS